MPSERAAQRKPGATKISSTPEPNLRRAWICIGLIALAGLGLRLPGLFTDFWLDEVWAWELVNQLVHSPIDVFTKVRLDGNHPLNTLLMYLMGPRQSLAVYRLPSLLAGVGAILVAARIALRRGVTHALAAATLIAVAFPFVVYSSEARGYSLAVFFTFLLLDQFDLFVIDWRLWRAVPIAIILILGCLSHATFVVTYIAVATWSASEAIQQAIKSSDWGAQIKRLVVCHALPIAFIPDYYFGFVFRLESGGANVNTVPGMVRDTLAFGLGFADGLTAGLLPAIAAGVICAAALVLVGLNWPGLLAMLIPGVILVPALMLGMVVAKGDMFLYPRYMITSNAMMLLALGLVLGKACQGQTPIRIVAMVMLVAVVVSNLYQDYRFNTIGRGGYTAAMKHIFANSHDGPITITSNHDFRTDLLTSFYARRVAPSREIHYINNSDAAAHPPDWYIWNTDNLATIPPEGHVGSARYLLSARYDSYGPSGTAWALYQREDSSSH